TVRALLDSAAQAILAVDTSGTIVMVNRMMETAFGYKTDELLGQSLDLLLPEEVRSRHHEHQKDYFANPRNRLMGIGLDLKGRHKTGSKFPIEGNLSHIETPAGTLGVAFVTDITQRRHVEQELRALPGRLIYAEEQERKRISRELHDDLNQKLGLLAFD